MLSAIEMKNWQLVIVSNILKPAMVQQETQGLNLIRGFRLQPMVTASASVGNFKPRF